MVVDCHPYQSSSLSPSCAGSLLSWDVTPLCLAPVVGWAVAVDLLERVRVVASPEFAGTVAAVAATSPGASAAVTYTSSYFTTTRGEVGVGSPGDAVFVVPPMSAEVR